MKKARKFTKGKNKSFNSSYLLKKKKKCSSDFKSYPDLIDYFANLRLKSHVQHAISLIKHQVGAAAQVGFPRLQEVDETSRCGDADFNAWKRRVIHQKNMRGTQTARGSGACSHLSPGLGSGVLLALRRTHRCSWCVRTCRSHTPPAGPAGPALWSERAPDTEETKRSNALMIKVKTKDPTPSSAVTHYRPIPSFQIGLVVDVDNGRKEVLCGGEAK